VRIRAESEGDEFVLNLTSLIDVIFNLLLFYMVATTFQDEERALEIELPAAQASAELPAEELVLDVLEDGRVFLLGAELSREELLQRLKSVAAADPATPVTIRGHRAARHEAIVGVMDACGLAGLSNLSVGTRREDRG
jgi:biopolymer transport protein ExbD